MKVVLGLQDWLLHPSATDVTSELLMFGVECSEKQCVMVALACGVLLMESL